MLVKSAGNFEKNLDETFSYPLPAVFLVIHLTLLLVLYKWSNRTLHSNETLEGSETTSFPSGALK